MTALALIELIRFSRSMFDGAPLAAFSACWCSSAASKAAFGESAMAAADADADADGAAADDEAEDEDDAEGEDESVGADCCCWPVCEFCCC